MQPSDNLQICVLSIISFFVLAGSSLAQSAEPSEPSEPSEAPTTEITFSNLTRDEPVTERLDAAQAHALLFLYSSHAKMVPAEKWRINPVDLTALIVNRAPPQVQAIATGLKIYPDKPGEIQADGPIRSVSEQIESYYVQIFSTKGGEGHSNLIGQYFDSLNSYTGKELIDEYATTAQRNLFEEFIRVIDSAGAGQGKWDLNDTNHIRYVELEFQIVRKIGTIKALTEFYKRRTFYKESVDARHLAFEEYVEIDKSEGYDQFIEDFGSNCLEYSTALEYRRAAKFRETEALVEQLQQASVPQGVSDWNTLKQITAWDDLVVDDLGSRYCEVAIDRAVSRAVELEKNLGLADDTQRESRAKILWLLALDAQKEITKLTGNPIWISIQPGAPKFGDVIREYRKPAVFGLVLLRERLFDIITQVYPDSSIRVNNLSTVVFQRDATLVITAKSTVDIEKQLRRRIKKVREQIKDLKKLVQKEFDSADTKLVKLDTDLRNFKKSVDAQHADAMEKLGEIKATVGLIKTDTAQILTKVEEIKKNTDELKGQSRLLREGLLPVPWPGEVGFDNAVVLHDLPSDLKSKIENALSAKIKSFLSAMPSTDTRKGSKTFKKYKRVLGQKIAYASYTVQWEYKVDPDSGSESVTFRSTEVGADKISNQLHLFFSGIGRINYRGKAKAKESLFRKNISTDCSGVLEVDFKVRLTVDPSDTSNWYSVSHAHDQQLRHTKFSNDLFRPFSGQLQDDMNGKIGDGDSSLLIKAIDDTSQAADVVDAIEALSGHARSNEWVKVN